MTIVAGCNAVVLLVIDFSDELMVVDDDDDLLVDKCANDDFVNFGSVVVVVVGLLPLFGTPK